MRSYQVTLLCMYTTHSSAAYQVKYGTKSWRFKYRRTEQKEGALDTHMARCLETWPTDGFCAAWVSCYESDVSDHPSFEQFATLKTG